MDAYIVPLPFSEGTNCDAISILVDSVQDEPHIVRIHTLRFQWDWTFCEYIVLATFLKQECATMNGMKEKSHEYKRQHCLQKQREQRWTRVSCEKMSNARWGCKNEGFNLAVTRENIVILTF